MIVEALGWLAKVASDPLFVAVSDTRKRRLREIEARYVRFIRYKRDAQYRKADRHPPPLRAYEREELKETLERQREKFERIDARLYDRSLAVWSAERLERFRRESPPAVAEMVEDSDEERGTLPDFPDTARFTVTRPTTPDSAAFVGLRAFSRGLCPAATREIELFVERDLPHVRAELEMIRESKARHKMLRASEAALEKILRENGVTSRKPLHHPRVGLFVLRLWEALPHTKARPLQRERARVIEGVCADLFPPGVGQWRTVRNFCVAAARKPTRSRARRASATG